MSNATDRVAAAVADAASSVALKATYAGGGLAGIGGWLLTSQGIAATGLCIAAAGWITQLVLGIRRDRREQREHDARMNTDQER
jgi:hypothetical protein